MSANKYNMDRIARGDITPDDITSLVRYAQTKMGLVSDGLCGPRTLEALHKLYPPKIPTPRNYVDHRVNHTPVIREGRGVRTYQPAARPWAYVTGICLHQTACHMGLRHERYDTMGAHFAVLRDGTILHLVDIDRVVYHGHSFNTSTVGIEIDGLYAGVEGRDDTVWDDPSTKVRERGMDLPDVQANAAKDVIRWIVATVAHNGGAITRLVAHRQASKNRRNDPGSAIWQTVALPMMAELGLTDGGDGATAGGLPIPREWDPNRTGRY